MTESLQQLWTQILHITSLFVIPDWGSLIGLLPVFLVIGVLGPLLSLVLLFWLIYVVRRPHGTQILEPQPYPAPLAANGTPEYPRGEPFCSRDRMVYPFGATRCDICGDALSVYCPKCGLGRDAAIDTCGNCGLVLRIDRRPRALRPAGPPPGGASLA